MPCRPLNWPSTLKSATSKSQTEWDYDLVVGCAAILGSFDGSVIEAQLMPSACFLCEATLAERNRLSMPTERTSSRCISPV